jgi:hypothetical protein
MSDVARLFFDQFSFCPFFNLFWRGGKGESAANREDGED